MLKATRCSHLSRLIVPRSSTTPYYHLISHALCQYLSVTSGDTYSFCAYAALACVLLSHRCDATTNTVVPQNRRLIFRYISHTFSLSRIRITASHFTSVIPTSCFLHRFDLYALRVSSLIQSSLRTTDSTPCSSVPARRLVLLAYLHLLAYE